jgi:hypothetical protein
MARRFLVSGLFSVNPVLNVNGLVARVTVSFFNSSPFGNRFVHLRASALGTTEGGLDRLPLSQLPLQLGYAPLRCLAGRPLGSELPSGLLQDVCSHELVLPLGSF